MLLDILSVDYRKSRKEVVESAVAGFYPLQATLGN